MLPGSILRGKKRIAAPILKTILNQRGSSQIMGYE